MPGGLAAALARTAPGGRLDPPCPPLAAGCAEAYLCELSSEPFPQLCGAAGGDRTQGCYAAAMPVCGSTRCGECKGFLGCAGEPGSVASGSTILDLRFTKCWDSVRPEGAGKFISQARSGCFHFSRERGARVFTMGGLVFPMLAGREGMRLYWERYPHLWCGRYPCCAWTIFSRCAAERYPDLRSGHYKKPWESDETGSDFRSW